MTLLSRPMVPHRSKIIVYGMECLATYGYHMVGFLAKVAVKKATTKKVTTKKVTVK